MPSLRLAVAFSQKLTKRIPSATDFLCTKNTANYNTGPIPNVTCKSSTCLKKKKQPKIMKIKSCLDESFKENKKTGETNVLVYSPKSASSSSRFDSWPLSFSFSWTTKKKNLRKNHVYFWQLYLRCQEWVSCIIEIYSFKLQLLWKWYNMTWLNMASFDIASECGH